MIKELGIVDEQLSGVQDECTHSEQSMKGAFSHPSPDEIEETANSSIQKICCLMANYQTITGCLNNEAFKSILSLEANGTSRPFLESDYSTALQVLLASCSSLDGFCFLQDQVDVLKNVQKLKEEYEVCKD